MSPAKISGFLIAIVVVVGIGVVAYRSGSGGPKAADAPTGSLAQPTNSQAQPDPLSQAPTVAGDANANVRSVAEAARTHSHPERLTPLIAPKPFNAAAFAANPQAYLDVVEPGRVFQSAAPGPQVPVLRVKGLGSQEIAPGATCPLTVITAPNAPVTFTTLDLGTFPNQLTSITVLADATGEASTTYSASGGAIADVQVMAGSPLASGQVKFQVFIAPPRPAAVKR